MTAGDVSFGTFLLLNRPSYRVSRIDLNATPIDISRQPAARREGSFVSLTRFTEKVIQVEGQVLDAGGSAATAQSNLDALLLALSNGLQNLKTGYNDERYWKARLSGEVTVQRLMPSLFTYMAQFLAEGAFAYALNASQVAPGPLVFN